MEIEDLIARGTWAVVVHPDFPERVRIVGPTSTGRFITVALDPTKHPAVWRPVTGRRSEAIEIAYYRREYL
ncbi:MAG: hypothetical protein EPO26_01515 [Chloroflexota bacterium]|nr:MAG: hypothetical protein EPO26_01515 [Chloroflexota bacterium]